MPGTAVEIGGSYRQPWVVNDRGIRFVWTGDVVGQVASQTLENLSVTGRVATLPIFRPLIGMDKDEITAALNR